MSKYGHSEAFAVLKNTNEKIAKNLTSHQYLTILDNHLYEALSHLVTSTKFFDIFLSQIIGWQTLNPKRKTCGVGRHELVNLSTLYFLTGDPKQKMKLVRRMKLHRNILFEALQRWLDILAEYPSIATMVGSKEVVLKLYDLNEAALMRQGYSLHSTYTQAKYWTAKAKSFKEMIVQKYTRMTINTAQRDYVKLGHQGQLSDYVQIYMMAMSKAIDKCDADRGVITSHIANWLLSAKNQAQAQMQNGGKDRHTHVSLEDEEIVVYPDDDERERQDTVDRVRVIAKLFDPTGVGRILLGIQEVLDQDAIAQLNALAVTEVQNTHLKAPTD